MKIKTVYRCKECGFESSKWLGKCSECESWNSFIEEAISTATSKSSKIKARARAPEEYETVLTRLEKETARIKTNIQELDTVLGGGIVPGSLALLGGEPGIGKSTLTLQICANISQIGKKVLYISGEESSEQVSMRGKRLNLRLKNFKILNETNLETAIATLDHEKPDLAVIDSIQVMHSSDLPSASGTVSQVRYCTETFMQWAKPKKIPILLIGHVTKDGNLAGPRVLEHLVDGVFILEGNRFHEFRILRGVKNRFGPTNEVGIFEMNEKGMSEVKNPSALFIAASEEQKSGAAIVCTMEGTRPLLVEVQALVSKTRFGYPRRMASGFDVNRLNLLIAVIERHLNINLGESDVFVNVVGGLKLHEPATDLGITLSILSSFRQKPLARKLAFSGEVGLSGEIRKVQYKDKRDKETKRIGLTLIAPDKEKETLKNIFERYCVSSS